MILKRISINLNKKRKKKGSNKKNKKKCKLAKQHQQQPFVHSSVHQYIYTRYIFLIIEFIPVN